jgi:hypothetical protein
MYFKISLGWNESHSGVATKHDLKELECKIMSQISEFASTVNANFVRIKNGIIALDKKIQEFMDTPGKLPPDEEALLKTISDDSGALAEAAEKPVVPTVPGGPGTGTTGVPGSIVPGAAGDPNAPGRPPQV